MGYPPLPALDIRQQPQPDVLGEYGRALSIRNLMQEQQLRQQLAPYQIQQAQQQVQAGQLENQARQRQAAQVDAMNKAYQGALTVGPDGMPTFDRQKVLASIASSGQGALAPGVVETFDQLDKRAGEAQRLKADVQKLNDEHVAAASDYVGSLASEVKAQNYTPAAIGLALAHAAGNGYQKEAEQLRGQISQMPPEKIPQLFDQLIQNSPKERAKITAAAEEARKEALAPSVLSKAESEAQIAKTTAQQGGSSVPFLEMNDWLKKHPGKGPSDYEIAMKKVVPAFSFNLQTQSFQASPSRAAATEAGKTGEDYLKAVPESNASVVRAIVEGRMPMPSSFAMRTPYWQMTMQDVMNYDPQFNTQRADLRRNFSTGKGATEINAINTAMGHAGVLADSIDALKNGNIKILNTIANQYGVQTGQTPVTTFNTIVHRLGPELTKAYIQAGGTLGERGTNEQDFNPNLGPDQLKANVGITAALLRSKISSLENQWDMNASPGMPKFQDRFIMPAAKKALDRLAPQTGVPTGQAQPTPKPAGQDFFSQFGGVAH